MSSIEEFLKAHGDALQVSLSSVSLILVIGFIALVYGKALSKRIKRKSPSLTGLWIHVPLLAIQTVFIYTEITKNNGPNSARLSVYALNGLIWVRPAVDARSISRCRAHTLQRPWLSRRLLL
jgi:hypothetical protein